MEDDAVEISSDDDLVEMSVAASPELAASLCLSLVQLSKRQPSPISSRCGISYIHIMLCYVTARPASHFNLPHKR